MLPGGTAVTVKVLPTGLNVWLMGSSVDYNRTEGKVKVHDSESRKLGKVCHQTFHVKIIMQVSAKDISGFILM